VTGRPRGLDLNEHGVVVAVEEHAPDTLHVAAGAALVPELLPPAAPEVRLAGLEGRRQRLTVDVGEDEDLAAGGILNDARREAVGTETDGGEKLLRVYVRPASRRARNSSMISTPALVPMRAAPALIISSTSS